MIDHALLRLYADCSTLLRPNESHSIEAGGLVLRLTVEYPAAAPLVPETPCEQDVLDAVRELFAETGRRAITKDVIARLTETGRLWGRSTTLNALASLVHKGLLVNPQDKRGYGPIPANPSDSPSLS